MKIKHTKQSGWLTTEMVIAIGIMATLISAMAVVGNTFKKVNDTRWMRHTVLAAGQAQMDAIVVTGKPIDKDTFRRLWPKVQCTVDVSQGTGQWQGLQKIQLDLSAKCRERTVKTSMVRYIPTDKELQK